MIEPGMQAGALIRREALTGAAVNLVINFFINAWMMRGKGPHRLSVDSIATAEHTVLGSAVVVAFLLALIAASISFFAFRKKAGALGLAPAARLGRPYFFFGVRQALASALFMFGAVVAAAVLFQRLLGTVEVSTAVAAAIVGFVAAVATWHASTLTSWALLREG